MENLVVWFDLPVKDMDRAKTFYENVLSKEVSVNDIQGTRFGLFPHDEGVATGCLWETDEEKPSADGIMVYFNVKDRLDEAVALVEKHGGQVLKPKHSIGPHGFRSIVLDTEGNRVALHSK